MPLQGTEGKFLAVGPNNPAWFSIFGPISERCSYCSKVRCAYNSLFRRIFGYRMYESVTELQISLARPTWEMLIEELKVGFFQRLSQCTAESPVHIFAIT